jgi:hypothetical protein
MINENKIELTETERIAAIRKKYLSNPPDGLSKKDISKMSDEDLLDMDYFLNEDIFDDDDDPFDFFDI